MYKQYRLQVAYIQEYFPARAEVVRKELGHLQRLAGEHDGSTVTVPSGDERLNLQSFFSHIWRTHGHGFVQIAVRLSRRFHLEWHLFLFFCICIFKSIDR